MNKNSCPPAFMIEPVSPHQGSGEVDLEQQSGFVISALACLISRKRLWITDKSNRVCFYINLCLCRRCISLKKINKHSDQYR